jgi:hypothetical protein
MDLKNALFRPLVVIMRLIKSNLNKKINSVNDCLGAYKIVINYRLDNTFVYDKILPGSKGSGYDT